MAIRSTFAALDKLAMTTFGFRSYCAKEAALRGETTFSIPQVCLCLSSSPSLRLPLTVSVSPSFCLPLPLPFPLPLPPLPPPLPLFCCANAAHLGEAVAAPGRDDTCRIWAGAE